MHPRELPWDVHSSQNARNAKDNVSRGTRQDLATNLAIDDSPYSSSGISQGHKPPTSATLRVGLTTQPHWPWCKGMNRVVEEYLSRVADMNCKDFSDCESNLLEGVDRWCWDRVGVSIESSVCVSSQLWSTS